MFKIRRRPWIIWLLALLFVIIAVVVLWYLTRDKQSILQKMNIPPAKFAALSLQEGQEWTPEAGSKVDSEGFVPVLENDGFILRMNLKTTQIIVVDKQSSHDWRSNPTHDQLKAETVKGLLLSNLQSVFILEFSQIGRSGNRELTNTMDKNIEKKIVKYEKGIQISYVFPEQKLRISVQYELTKNGLKVQVPTDGIKEDGEYRMLSLDLLPFFGAANAGSDGYFLVPDGPGGLIHYKTDRTVIGNGYNHRIYGDEVSNPLSRYEKNPPRYPVFGVKSGDSAFVAITQLGRFETKIKALSPGMKSNLYSIYPNFIYREEYLRKTSRINPPVKAIQQNRTEMDWSVEYRFLTASDTTYVGMANAYREYLLEEKQLAQPLDKVDHIPLNLTIIGGNSRKAFNRDQYVTMTTFQQAADMVRGLTESGVKNQRIIYYGWQDEGSYDTTRHFPVEKKLGGATDAVRFIAEVHKLGHKVIFEDEFVWVDPKSSLGARGNGIYAIDETVFIDFQDEFILKPSVTMKYAYDVIEKLKKLGVDGIHYSSIGGLVFRDYNPGQPLHRRDTAYYYDSLLAYTKQSLGLSSVTRGNDYTLSETSFITSINLESDGNFMVDETVPFYPITLHGYISYSAENGNIRQIPQKDFLRSIEYGAVPAFVLSSESARKLKGTPNDDIFSTQYDMWKSTVIAEYLQYDKLSALYHQRIAGHVKLRPGVYMTTYEDGTRVTVDYNNNTFELDHQGGTSNGE